MRARFCTRLLRTRARFCTGLLRMRARFCTGLLRARTLLHRLHRPAKRAQKCVCARTCACPLCPRTRLHVHAPSACTPTPACSVRAHAYAYPLPPCALFHLPTYGESVHTFAHAYSVRAHAGACTAQSAGIREHALGSVQLDRPARGRSATGAPQTQSTARHPIGWPWWLGSSPHVCSPHWVAQVVLTCQYFLAGSLGSLSSTNTFCGIFTFCGIQHFFTRSFPGISGPDGGWHKPGPGPP